MRSERHETPVHVFAIGQAVRLRASFVTPALLTDLFRITGQMPAQAGSLQYRIRSADERHERVTTQESLEAVDVWQPDSGSSLLETTFGNR